MDAEELLEEVKRHRGKRRGGWGLIVVILIIVGLGVYWIIRPIVKQADFKISGQTFHVRVVHSDKDKEQGLALFKRPIEKDEGLLMVFDKSGYYSIWMKNIDYKIDVLWLDSNKKVVHYVENMDPEAEDYLVSSIDLLAENSLKVWLNSGDIVNVISHFKTGNYLFKKINGDFKKFNARNWGDDKLKIVTNGDKLGSFELYRTRDNDSFFAIDLFEEQGRYYLIVSEPDRPWQRDEVADVQFDGKQITCHLKNGDTFYSEIVCVPYVADLINNVSKLLE